MSNSPFLDFFSKSRKKEDDPKKINNNNNSPTSPKKKSLTQEYGPTSGLVEDPKALRKTESETVLKKLYSEENLSTLTNPEKNPANNNEDNGTSSPSSSSSMSVSLHTSGTGEEENVLSTIPDYLDSEFSLLSVIGKGASGTVYHGRSPNGQDIALKMIRVSSKEVQRMVDIKKERELMEKSKCDHPNLVGYHGSLQRKNQLWILMDFCSGGSAADLIKNLNYEEILQKKKEMELSLSSSGPLKRSNSTNDIALDPKRSGLDEEVIAYVMRETIKAVAYLHSIGILHRDLKAGNILFTLEGQVKVSDLGVSADLTQKSTRNTVAGSPYWMAPEIMQEVGHNEKADIWSLGITTIELRESVPPYFQKTPLNVMFEIPKNPPPVLQEPDTVSNLMNNFIASCCKKEPSERSSAEQLLSHPFFNQVQPCSATHLSNLVQKSRDIKQELSKTRGRSGSGFDSVKIKNFVIPENIPRCKSQPKYCLLFKEEPVSEPKKIGVLPSVIFGLGIWQFLWAIVFMIFIDDIYDTYSIVQVSQDLDPKIKRFLDYNQRFIALSFFLRACLCWLIGIVVTSEYKQNELLAKLLLKVWAFYNICPFLLILFYADIIVGYTEFFTALVIPVLEFLVLAYFGFGLYKRLKFKID